MQPGTPPKEAFLRFISLPAVRNIIIILGVVVALLVGYFTLYVRVSRSAANSYDEATTGVPEWHDGCAKA